LCEHHYHHYGDTNDINKCSISFAVSVACGLIGSSRLEEKALREAVHSATQDYLGASFQNALALAPL
jgi:hypothetical protein